MKYQIGDVARCLGITPAGLHYFEKEGLMEPLKGNESRRFYSLADFNRLISYRKYRSMELPLKEITRQFSPEGCDRHEISEKLRIREEKFREDAARAMEKAEELGRFVSSFERAEKGIGRIDLEPIPVGSILSYGKDGWISTNREEQKHIAAWLDELPFTRIGVCTEAMGQGTPCYFMREGHPLPSTPEGLKTTRAGVALHTFSTMGKEMLDDYPSVFGPLWEYAEKHGMRQNGVGLALHLCVECNEQKMDTLSEVWLPVELIQD